MSNNQGNPTPFVQDIGDYPIKVTALGGLDEMGKNCYVIEVNNDAFVIEAGMKYPPKNTPGVDLVIPDFDYLSRISKRVKAIIITHGHDDQYGALPYLMNVVKAPIYGSKTTNAIIKSELPHRFHIEKCTFIDVDPSSDMTISGHEFQFFQTTHSVSESFGFALKTPFGNIVYTGDFMSDYSPLKGFKFDLTKVARLSEEQNTFLLMTESECANKPGIASPLHKITDYIKAAIEEPTGRTFVSIYSQNFYNIQEVINMARKFRKKICIADPTQIPFFDAMNEIGDIVIPSEMRVSLDDLRITPVKDVIILITGSGEALFKYCKEICYGNIKNLKVETNDTWINAAPSVPGTEVSHTDTCDTIYRTDCHVINLGRKQVSSMHAQQEDLRMMISLFRPKYYMPIKGDFRLLMENAKLAIDLGIGLNHFNTFVYDNGMALCFDNQGKPVRKIIMVKNGDILVDGSSVAEVKENTIEERTRMADGGVVILGLAVSMRKRDIVSAPDIQMRGFLYFKESEALITQLSQMVMSNVQSYFDSDKRVYPIDMEHRISDKASKFIRKTTDKDPLVITKIIDVDSLEEFDPR